MVSLPRILVINSSDSFGGAEKVLWNTLQPWRDHREKAKCKFLLPGRGEFFSVAESEKLSCEFFSLGNRLANVGDSPVRPKRVLKTLVSLIVGLPYLLGAICQIRNTFKLFSPEVVVANGFKAQILAGLSINRMVAQVWYFQDFVSNRKLVSKILPILCKKKVIFIADSESVSTDIQVVFPGRNIIIWRNTVDTKVFKPIEEKNVLTSEINSRRINVGLVATFAKWKGHEVFFRAAKKVLDEVSWPVRFVVVGGPVYKAAESQWSLVELQKNADSLDLGQIIEFTGFQKNIVDIYQQLDIVVHASTEPEPFGQVIIEGMACGKPVIVAAHGGAAEIGKSGEELLHHIPGDYQSLANAILTLLKDDDLRSKIGLAARRAAVRNFDISITHSRWDELIAQIGS